MAEMFDSESNTLKVWILKLNIAIFSPKLFYVNVICLCFAQCVDWSPFGFTGRDGTQSTFWLGTAGSNTVGHYDTYGCNLVAQIHGV